MSVLLSLISGCLLLRIQKETDSNYNSLKSKQRRPRYPDFSSHVPGTSYTSHHASCSLFLNTRIFQATGCINWSWWKLVCFLNLFFCLSILFETQLVRQARLLLYQQTSRRKVTFQSWRPIMVQTVPKWKLCHYLAISWTSFFDVLKRQIMLLLRTRIQLFC